MSRGDESKPAVLSELTPRQQAFVDAYLLTLNAKQSAIKAGYSEKTAEQQGSRLLSNAKVAAAINERMREREERTKIDADYVLRRMVEIDQMDVLDIMTDDMALKPVSQWPKSWRQYLSGFDVSELSEGFGDQREMTGLLKKIRWPDKIRNLELLGRHLGMFREKLEVTGRNGGAIEHKHSVKVVIVPQKQKAEVETRPLKREAE